MFTTMRKLVDNHLIDFIHHNQQHQQHETIQGHFNASIPP